MKPDRINRLLGKLDAATRGLDEVARKLRETPAPDPPDINMGTLRDVVRLAKELDEEITYECARQWLMTGRSRLLYTSVEGHFILDLDHAKVFLEGRKRRRETDSMVREAELEAAWPRRQTVEELAASLHLHPSWVRGAVNLGLLRAAGTAPSGVPYFEFSYRKMKELRSQRMDLIGAVNRADAAEEKAQAKKKRECDEAAFRADRDRQDKIENEHARQDRIAGRR